MKTNLALCTCGYDITDHIDEEGMAPSPWEVPAHVFRAHQFKASGSKYRCDKIIQWSDGSSNFYICQRPKYHDDEGIPCGPLTGDYLW